MRFFFLYLLLLLANPCTTAAQDLPPPGEDLLGLYIAPDFNEPNAICVEAEPGEVATVYLLLTNPRYDDDGVCGFECLLSLGGASTWIGVEFPVEAINLAVFPELFVGWGQLLWPVEGVVHLATVTFMYADDSEERVFVGPTSTPTLPGELAYCWGMGLPTEMFPASGSFDEPIFGVNNCGALPESPITWGAVKALFSGRR